jgi:hypothetical protein
MSRLHIQPLPGHPFLSQMHGAIAIDFPPEKAGDVEAMLQKAIDDLRALPPTEVPAVAGATARIQPPAVMSGGGIRPPPSPHGHQGNVVRPGGAPAPPPLPGGVLGAGALPQPAIAPPPAPPQGGITQHPRPQANVIARVIPAQRPAGAPPRPGGRVRLGAGRPEDVAATALAEAEARAAEIAARPPPPPVVADVPMGMGGRGGGAALGENQTNDGRLINPDTGQPYRAATKDEKGRPIVTLPQGEIFGPPPPPPK